MPTHSYPTVSPTGPTGDGGLGKRNQNNLNASYPGSPIYDGTYSNTEAVKTAKDADGMGAAAVVLGVAPRTDDGGYMYSATDLSFSAAPDITKVETGGGGLPADPFYPNITSPGEGSQNASDQEPYSGDPIRRHSLYGSGLGSRANPSETSKSIGNSVVGSYISGRSFLGSDGR